MYSKERKIESLILDKLDEGSFLDLDQYCTPYKKILVIEDHFHQTGMYSCQWANRQESKIEVNSTSPCGYSFRFQGSGG